MKILFTGATGVIGRRAVPLLIEGGHEVAATHRSESDGAWLTEVGATPIELDLFDPRAVTAAVSGNDAVFHFATSIPSLAEMKKRSSWDMNDQLRTTATTHLVDAAIEGNVTTFIQESITFPYADGGDSWIDETSRVDPCWETLSSALVAEQQVQRFSDAGGKGVVLRFSSLYGPGRTSAEYVASVVKRQLPVIGSGNNFVSSLHIADAANALLAALHAPAGVYNVTDDGPVPGRKALETLATLLGARRPRRIPGWIAKVAVGDAAKLMTTSHRISNAKFKSATGWVPSIPSILIGWEDVAAERSAVA